MEHYFDELEDELVQRLHQEAMTEEGRAELVRSTGVDDSSLVDELVRLGITADGLIALRLFPLVLVAWAEGSVDAEERDDVVGEAFRLGIREDSTARVILDSWLKRRPPGLGVDAWRRYVGGLLFKMSSVAAERLVELTKTQMVTVAKSSGGHFGFGKVSQKEQVMIDKLVAEMKRVAAGS